MDALEASAPGIIRAQFQMTPGSLFLTVSALTALCTLFLLGLQGYLGITRVLRFASNLIERRS